jgi:predicted nucleic acid-binding protein
MTAYLDSSVLLRHVLGQPDSLRELRLVRTSMSSRILEVECVRTLDRLRIERAFPERRLATLRQKLCELLTAMEIIEVTRGVLTRAAQPTPTSLGTLDAIHLCSALAWRERSGRTAVFATHDEALAIAAEAQGFRVLGV